MPQQKSYGIVPLRRKAHHWEALLVKRQEGFWEFPKGHSGPEESPLEAATRELKEETGLDIKKVLFSNPIKIEYKFTYDQELISKTVYYFIAEVLGTIHLQPEETIDSKWVPLEEAADYVTYANSRELCHKVCRMMSNL
jgi:8-oxo-dGTP pyrophosphatase MutT (NUDIX family)